MKKRKASPPPPHTDKREVVLMTLQGICMESLAGNLPDADIHDLQRVFKAELVKREKARVAAIVCKALPSWAALEGFEVSCYAVSGSFRGLKLTGTPLSNGYATFEVKGALVLFHADALKAMVATGLVAPDTHKRLALRPVDAMFARVLPPALRALGCSGETAMVAEYLAFHKARHGLLRKI